MKIRKDYGGNMTSQEVKERFIEEYNKYIKREGADKLLKYLESSDFFTAPASTKYHSAFEGGLCYHSLMTFYETIRLLKAYKDKIEVSGETAAISALLHDVCKIGCYKISTKNVKKDGVWVQEPYYVWDEDFKYGGHGSKSVFLINRYMQLTDEEAVAINCHMGPWDSNSGYTLHDAYSKYPFAWVIHVADEATSIISEEN